MCKLKSGAGPVDLRGPGVPGAAQTPKTTDFVVLAGFYRGPIELPPLDGVKVATGTGQSCVTATRNVVFPIKELGA